MKEKKQLYVKYKATEQFGILDEHEMLEDSDGISKQFELYANISEFIFNFEENKKKKKDNKPAKGVDQFIGEDL
jgi:transposase-like protein